MLKQDAVEMEARDLERGLKAVGACVRLPADLGWRGSVIIDAQGDLARFAATDGEMYLSMSVAAHVEGRIHAAVRYQAFAQWAKLARGKVRLDLTKKMLVCRVGTSTMRLGRMIDIELFPPEPDVELPSRTIATVPGEDLVKALALCAPAISDDEDRALLNSVEISVGDGQFTCVACDGHRLVVVRTECHGNVYAVIPRRAVSVIRRVLGEDGGVKIAAAGNWVRITQCDVRFYASVTRGEYTKWQEVAKVNAPPMDIPCDDLRAALAQVNAMADGAGVKMSFGTETLELDVDAEFGSAHCEVPVEFSNESSAKMNARYLLDAISPIAGTVEISQETPGSPMKITSDSIPGYQCVIMPMRA